MKSLVVATKAFESSWPLAAEHARQRWSTDGDVRVVRVSNDDAKRPVGQMNLPADVDRLLLLGATITADCLTVFTQLKEVGLSEALAADEPVVAALAERNIEACWPPSEGYWGQSVSEFALGLTLRVLRRIPQTHHAMLSGHDVWNYQPDAPVAQGRLRAYQFGDDDRFVNGTLEGKRVRVGGLGNIGARYASFCNALGADVAAWDPMASEPAFHRSSARRVWRLEDLATDADIFAPMMPLVPATRGLFNADVISALPKGALLIVVTRMGICDATAIRQRVLANEITLAADVFDVEPLPLDDDLLGRHNVVHTPHNAGRTAEANRAFADAILDQFCSAAV